MLTWEQVPQDHSGELMRVKVPGGWLIKEYQNVQTSVNTGMPQNELKEGYEWRVAMCFMPDPEYKWEL